VRTRPFAHVPDTSLLIQLGRLAAHERASAAELIACMAEVNARKLYRGEGYSSMHRYCVGVLRMSDDVAYKRIRAARLSRRFPRIIEALADGRLNLTGLAILSYHITQANGVELLTAAEGKSIAEIRLLMAERFPQPDLATVLMPLAPTAGLSTNLDLNPIPVTQPAPPTASTFMVLPARSEAPATSRVRPLAPERFALQTTIDDEGEALLREAHELLGHPTATSHVPEVLKQALRLYVEKLRKQKFGAADSPRPGRESNPDSRHVPNEVKRAVWTRDGGQCTFTNEDGRRCLQRSGLEYDHIVPHSRGGSATIDNIRLLCWAHNQLEAERSYGPEFMDDKRESRRRA
jgi:hypothetical protein